MPSLSAGSIEQLFAPEANLTSYEGMSGRDLYVSFMRGAFRHQGKPAEDSDIMAGFSGIYVAAPNNAVTNTDETISAGEDDEEAIRLETGILDKAYAGAGRPYGPSAHVRVSTMDDAKTVSFGVSARQDGQELFLDASAVIIDPLTQKDEKKSTLFGFVWAGSVKWIGSDGGCEASEAARRRFKPSVFREMTKREKRLVGVTLESLGQLATA